MANKNPGDLVRIWSVPCSTGEEPYSIAIWLLENWPLVDAYHIEIVGSDIDTRVLSEAAIGLIWRAGAGAVAAGRHRPVFRTLRGSSERHIIQDLRGRSNLRKLI